MLNYFLFFLRQIEYDRHHLQVFLSHTPPPMSPTLATRNISQKFRKEILQCHYLTPKQSFALLAKYRNMLNSLSLSPYYKKRKNN